MRVRRRLRRTVGAVILLSICSQAETLAASNSYIRRSVESPHPEGRRLWKWSAVVLAGALAADSASSWNRYEANPLLRSADGRFQGGNLALKAGIAGGGLLAQWLILRKRPEAARAASTVNFSAAGLLGGAAIHNLHVSK